MRGSAPMCIDERSNRKRFCLMKNVGNGQNRLIADLKNIRDPQRRQPLIRFGPATFLGRIRDSSTVFYRTTIMDKAHLNARQLLNTSNNEGQKNDHLKNVAVHNLPSMYDR